MINENFKIPQSLRSFGMTTNGMQHEMRRRRNCKRKTLYSPPPHTLSMQKACHSERSEESRTIRCILQGNRKGCPCLQGVARNAPTVMATARVAPN